MHMSHRTSVLLLLLMACPSSVFAAAPQPDPGKAACEVWQRELSFAQSVARHDATAFASHLQEDAIFGANTAKPTRGRAAIGQQWAAIVAGKTVHLDWYPQHVVTTGDGTLAYSSGAYLYEDPAPNAKPRYTIGAFSTLWRRGRDGVWRVAFDGGDDGKPASDTEVAAFRAGRQTGCPIGTKKG
jgi:ketosteroid isomerase-like protein